MSNLEKARGKYKPKKIKYLFIAEAPPREEFKRFFYYEKVSKGDSLFLETMKVLYPECYKDTKYVRENKKEFLEKFQKDGYYLIDAVEKPFEKNINRRAKKKEIRSGLDNLKKKIKKLISRNAKVILIAKTVYDVCAKELPEFNVANKVSIPFPIGWQREFRDGLGKALRN